MASTRGSMPSTPGSTPTSAGTRADRSSVRARRYPSMMYLDIKRFDQPDELRRFPLGTFEVIRIGDLTIGRASYEPGWRWSEHVGPITGASSCKVSHAGLVLSGRAAVRMDDGHTFEMAAGDVFTVPGGHDSWVLGDEPYVSLHFLGADDYAVE